MNRPTEHPVPDHALTAGAKVTIRPMTAADADAAARLATQLGYPSTAEDVLRRFHAMAAVPESHVAVAVSDTGSVVGWIHVFGNRLLESEPDAEIGGLVVDESFRGRGAGTALVAAAEAWAHERGYGVVKTQVKFRKTIAR